MFKKLCHYIKLAIKKPYLIKDAIYKQHLGIILLCNIQDYINFRKDNKNINKCKFEISNNIDKIFDYYNRMGRSSITKEKIQKWLQEGHHCWLATLDNKVVGALWMFFGQVTINQLSARVLSVNKTITFNNDTGYEGYVLIDSGYRGQGIYGSLKDYVINHYHNDGKIRNVILITGASNGAMIRTIMKSHGKLIGIVKVKNILGRITRKEIFVDKKEKVWK